MEDQVLQLLRCLAPSLYGGFEPALSACSAQSSHAQVTVHVSPEARCVLEPQGSPAVSRNASLMRVARTRACSCCAHRLRGSFQHCTAPDSSNVEVVSQSRPVTRLQSSPAASRKASLMGVARMRSCSCCATWPTDSGEASSACFSSSWKLEVCLAACCRCTAHRSGCRSDGTLHT